MILQDSLASQGLVNELFDELKAVCFIVVPKHQFRLYVLGTLVSMGSFVSTSSFVLDSFDGALLYF